jgi:hypothetical protein
MVHVETFLGKNCSQLIHLCLPPARSIPDIVRVTDLGTHKDEEVPVASALVKLRDTYAPKYPRLCSFMMN